MVRAMLALYQAAIDTGNYSRFILLSGEDYPIMRNDQIYALFLDDDMEYVRATTRFSHVVITGYWFWKLRSKFLVRAVRWLLTKLGIQKQPNFKVGDAQWTVYRGSQWQVLTRAAVEHILAMVKRYLCIEQYFRYSRAADELLIPTILMNSERFHSKVFASDGPEEHLFVHLAVTHFLQISSKKGETVKVLTEEAFESVIQSGKPFLRKVRSGESDELIRMLQEHRT